jgi:glycosyltransferase involved in cell wall biosynthesis
MNAGSERLRVLFDAYWAVEGPPSGRHVLQSLVRSWTQAFPQDEIAICIPSFASSKDTALVEMFGAGVSIIRASSPVRNHGFWALTSLGRKTRGFDAVISQNFTPLSFGGTECVRIAFLHDTLFVDHPEWFTAFERLYLGAIRPSLRQADLVLTSSEAESNRISRVWPEVGAKTTAIGLGVPLGLSTAEPRRPAGFDLEQHQFILSVGRLNVRKNIQRLVAAYLAVADVARRFDLVIVGAPNGRADSANVEALPPSVRFTGSVSDSELRWLYEHAALFVFPSLDEGFGLPLVEAHAFGTPSIASDIEPFREIGTAELYFDPESMPSISQALATMLAPGEGPRRLAASWGEAPDQWNDAVVATRWALRGNMDERRSACFVN